MGINESGEWWWKFGQKSRKGLLPAYWYLKRLSPKDIRLTLTSSFENTAGPNII